MKPATLEQKLRDHPDDLASWRAYAELIGKKGDTRATLIHLEQRRARVAPSEREAVEREIAKLVDEHQRSWDAELPSEATVVARRYGFPTKVAIEWSENAPVPIERALRGPFVTALHIKPGENRDDLDQDAWDLDEWDKYNRLDEPEPSPSIKTGALATLDLSRLVELDLGYLRIGPIGAQTLAVSAYLRGDAAEVRDLASSTTPGRLGVLDLRYCRVGDAGLAALASAPSFNGVHRLRLQRNALTAEGMRALHGFTELTELDLRYNAIGADGVRALLEAPFIGSLKRLLLYRDDIDGDAGAKLLANAPQLPPTLRCLWRSA